MLKQKIIENFFNISFIGNSRIDGFPIYRTNNETNWKILIKFDIELVRQLDDNSNTAMVIKLKNLKQIEEIILQKLRTKKLLRLKNNIIELCKY